MLAAHQNLILQSYIKYARYDSKIIYCHELHKNCAVGKNRGPAKPLTMTLWISMFWPFVVLQSLRRIYRPELQIFRVSSYILI